MLPVVLLLAAGRVCALVLGLATSERLPGGQPVLFAQGDIARGFETRATTAEFDASRLALACGEKES